MRGLSGNHMNNRTVWLLIFVLLLTPCISGIDITPELDRWPDSVISSDNEGVPVGQSFPMLDSSLPRSH